MIEGQTTIIQLLPEGSAVKKGQVVCELDSATLKDQLVNQWITVKSAEASYENAKLAREVAEIAVVEYAEGIYKQELKVAEGCGLPPPSRPFRKRTHGSSGRGSPVSECKTCWPRKGGEDRPPTSWPSSISTTASNPLS